MTIFSESHTTPLLRAMNALEVEPPKRPELLSFVVSEARKGREELGFIPMTYYGEAAADGRLWLCESNGDLLGFLLGGRVRNQTRIHQLWMRADARRRLYGTLLVVKFCGHVAECGGRHVTCACANDLDAVEFWPALGFRPIWQRMPNNYRRRSVTQFQKPLVRIGARYEAQSLIERGPHW